jgi:hypothetical protein
MTILLLPRLAALFFDASQQASLQGVATQTLLFLSRIAHAPAPILLVTSEFFSLSHPTVRPPQNPKKRAQDEPKPCLAQGKSC